MQRWQCPIFNGTLETSIQSKKCLFLRVSPLIFINKKCASHFRRKTANENKTFKKTETWISNSYLIRQRFKGCCCKSGSVMFEWRITWNYAYRPFKSFVWNLLGIFFDWHEVISTDPLFADLCSRNKEENWRNSTRFEIENSDASFSLSLR